MTFVTISGPEKIQSCTLENTPKFIIQTNGRVECKVLKVCDGDTLDVAMKYPQDHYNRFTIRMYGIDTPEKRPLKNIENRDQIVKEANEAWKYLEEEILNKIMYISIVGYDKYARLLGILYKDLINDHSVNDDMIKNGYAVKYDGGSKQTNKQK